jgi:hypothetical protein
LLRHKNAITSNIKIMYLHHKKQVQINHYLNQGII